MTDDHFIRAAAALVVVAVAAFAAAVSYTHVYDLTRAHGQGWHGSQAAAAVRSIG